MVRGARFLVPRRPDGGERDRLWAHCRTRWAQGCPDIPIVEGASPEGMFNRAAAINDAARGDWDVGVILDADVIAEPEQVYAAIEQAQNGHLTLAFEHFMGLNVVMTKRILAGYRGNWAKGVRYKSPIHESSLVVVPRALWDEVGGFDERFVGWGQEDVAFAHACRVLAGIQRVPGIVWHLYHSKSVERDSRTDGYRANQELGRRYRFTKEPEAMRALLDERQQTFERIWKRNGWNGVDTKAGPGSSLGATEALREWLPKTIAELGVSSVLDAGCSDSLWMPELPGYVGVDIVPQAIAKAKERHPDRTYQVADICGDELPRCEAIVCRDALQHLSLLDGLTALQNFRRSGAKWLLASSHRGEENTDVPSGGYYASNLEAAPFWLGTPRMEIPDGSWDMGVRFPTKLFGVWEL